MIKASVERRKPGGDILERIEQALAGPKTVKVGFIAGEADEGILKRAIVNEFGATIPVTDKMRGWFWRQGSHVGKSTITIPERPFFRTAMQENKPKYRKLMRDEAKKIMQGQSTMKRALDRLGAIGVSDVQASILEGDWKPNSQFTIERKGSSRPLNDDGTMRQSVKSAIE